MSESNCNCARIQLLADAIDVYNINKNKSLKRIDDCEVILIHLELNTNEILEVIKQLRRWLSIHLLEWTKTQACHGTSNFNFDIKLRLLRWYQSFIMKRTEVQVDTNVKLQFLDLLGDAMNLFNDFIHAIQMFAQAASISIEDSNDKINTSSTPLENGGITVYIHSFQYFQLKIQQVKGRYLHSHLRSDDGILSDILHRAISATNDSRLENDIEQKLVLLKFLALLEGIESLGDVFANGPRLMNQDTVDDMVYDFFTCVSNHAGKCNRLDGSTKRILIERITQKLSRQPISDSNVDFKTISLMELLKSLRTQLQEKLSDSEILEVMTFWNNSVYQLLQTIFEKTLGPWLSFPPLGLKYAVVMLGSYARGEGCPYSDLEFMILYQCSSGFSQEVITKYFEFINNLFRMEIASIGEDNQLFEDHYVLGLRFDDVYTPFGSGQLCFQLNETGKVNLEGDSNIDNMLIAPKVLFGDSILLDKLLTNRSAALKHNQLSERVKRMNQAKANIKTHLSFYQSYRSSCGESFEVKKELRLLVTPILEVSACYGISQSYILHHIERLDALGVIDHRLAEVLLFGIRWLHKLRCKSHLFYNSEWEEFVVKSDTDRRKFCLGGDDLQVWNMFNIMLQPVLVDLLVMMVDNTTNIEEVLKEVPERCVQRIAKFWFLLSTHELSRYRQWKTLSSHDQLLCKETDICNIFLCRSNYFMEQALLCCKATANNAFNDYIHSKYMEYDRTTHASTIRADYLATYSQIVPDEFGRNVTRNLCGEVFVKEYPELPGIEYMASDLAYRFCGENLTTIAGLARMKSSKGTHEEAIPVLLSKSVIGHNLHNILKLNPRFIEQHLDHENFSAHVLRTLLLFSEDDKPDNGVIHYVGLTPNTLKCKLVMVDNDHSFMNETLERTRFTSYKVKLKSILFCSNLMFERVHSSIIDRIVTLDVESELFAWFADLCQQNDRHLEMFDESEWYQEVTTKHGKLSTTIPMMVDKELGKKLFCLLKHIQQICKCHRDITHDRLLELVDPALHKCYMKVVNKENKITTEERFAAITKGEYQIVGSKRISQSSGSMILLSAIGKIPAQEDVQNHHTFSPKHIMTELEAQFPKGWEQTVTNVRKDLLLHQSSVSFVSLPSSILREEVISGVLTVSSISITSMTVLQSSNSGEHPNAHMLPIQWNRCNEYQQVFVFDLLSKAIIGTNGDGQSSYFTAFSSSMKHHDLTTLVLRGAQYLTDAWLIKIVQQSQQSLIFLDVRDCPLLSFSIMDRIITMCPHLKVFRHDLHRNKATNDLLSMNNSSIIKLFSEIHLDSGRSQHVVQALFERFLDGELSPQETKKTLLVLKKMKIVNLDAVREAILILLGGCFVLGRNIDDEYISELDKLLSQLYEQKRNYRYHDWKLVLIGYICLLLYNDNNQSVANVKLTWHVAFDIDSWLQSCPVFIDAMDHQVWSFVTKVVEESMIIPNVLVLFLVQNCLSRCSSEQRLIRNEDEYPSLGLCIQLLFCQSLSIHDQLQSLPLLSYYDVNGCRNFGMEWMQTLTIIEFEEYVDRLILVCDETQALQLPLSQYIWIGLAFPYVSNECKCPVKLEKLLKYMVTFYEWTLSNCERLLVTFGAKLIQMFHRINTSEWVRTKVQTFVTIQSDAGENENTMRACLYHIAIMDEANLVNTSTQSFELCVGLVLQLLNEIKLKGGSTASNWTTAEAYLLECLGNNTEFIASHVSVPKLRSPSFMILVFAINKLLSMSNNRSIIRKLIGDFMDWAIQRTILLIMGQFQKAFSNVIDVVDNKNGLDELSDHIVTLSHAACGFRHLNSSFPVNMNHLNAYLGSLHVLRQRDNYVEDSEGSGNTIFLTKLEVSSRNLQELICVTIVKSVQEATRMLRFHSNKAEDLHRIQSCLVNTLRMFFQGGMSVTVVIDCVCCVKISLIDWLLDEFPFFNEELKTGCIELMKTIIKHHITAATLKRMIRVLNAQDKIDISGSKVRRPYVTQVLRDSFGSCDDPQSFFLFEGRSCGIHLPPFEHWPGLNGYTFCTWISFQDWDREQFQRYQGCNMTIFSVHQSNGIGFDVIVTPNQVLNRLRVQFRVEVTYDVGQSSTQAAIGSIEITDIDKWHFLSISHSKGGFMGRSFIAGVIGNETPFRIEINYPRFVNSPTRAGIGCQHPFSDGKLFPFNYSSFYGRLSTVLVFSEPFPMTQLQRIGSLCWNRLHEISANLEDFSSLGLDSSMHYALALMYHPSLHQHQILLDITNREVGNKWLVTNKFSDEEVTFLSGTRRKGSVMNGKMLSGTYAGETKSIRSALDSLGGLKVVLPIFDPTMLGAQVGDAFAEALHIFVSVLRNSSEDKQYMIDQGFAFLKTSLTKMNPSKVTVHTAEALIALSERFSNDDEWTITCVDIIFCDFQILSKISFVCQELILEKLKEYASNHGDLVKTHIGLTRFLNGLSLYFVSSIQSQQRLANYEQVVIDRIDENQTKELDHNQIGFLRDKLYDVMSTVLLTTSQSIDSEIQMFFSYILGEIDPAYIVRGLRWFLDLLEDDNMTFLIRLLHAIRHGNVLYSIGYFTSHEEVGVRLLAWLVICTSLHKATLFIGKTISSEDYEFQVQMKANVVAALGIEVNTMTDWLLGLLSRTCICFDASDAASQEKEGFWLFEILRRTFFGQNCKEIVTAFEQLSPSSLGRETFLPAISPKSHIRNPDNDSSAVRKISIPMIFPVLVELLKNKFIMYDMKNRLFLAVAQNLCAVENNDIILGIPHWQALLIELVCATTSIDRSVDAYYAAFQHTIETVFGTLHTHAFLLTTFRDRRFEISAPTWIPRFDYMTSSAADIVRRKGQLTILLSKTTEYVVYRIDKGELDTSIFGIRLLRLSFESLLKMEEQFRHSIVDELLQIQILLSADTICEFLLRYPTLLLNGKSNSASSNRESTVDIATIDQDTLNLICSVQRLVCIDFQSQLSPHSSSPRLEFPNRLLNRIKWMLCRILLTMILGGLNCDMHCPTYIQKLTVVLNWTIKSSPNDYLEDLFVLGKLSLALHESQVTCSSATVLQLIAQIAINYKPFLSKALFMLTERDVDPASGLVETISDLPVIDVNTLREMISHSSLKPYSLQFMDTTASVNGDNDVICNRHLEDCICNSLELPLDTPHFWLYWQPLMQQVIKLSSDKETMDELNKCTEELSFRLDAFKNASLDAKRFYLQRIDSEANKLIQLNEKQKRNSIRLEHSKRKIFIKNYSTLMTEMFGHRGPWDIGITTDNHVVWGLYYREESTVDGNRMKRMLTPYTDEDDKDKIFSCMELVETTASITPQCNIDHSAGDVVASPGQSAKNQNITALHQHRTDVNSDTDELPLVNREESEDDSRSEMDYDAIPSLHSTKPQEKVLLTVYCELISPNIIVRESPVRGVLTLTKTYLSFVTSHFIVANELGTLPTSSLPLLHHTKRFEKSMTCNTNTVVDVLQRFYLQRFTAAEVFTSDRNIYFINFMEEKHASRFQFFLRKVCRPPNLQVFRGKKPQTILSRFLYNWEPLVVAWANRRISNFDYLMRLNTIAGRGFNDLSQYPIFPWIIADYTSNVLDLKNPSTFRDLRYPIGAQTELQRRIAMRRYESMMTVYDPNDEHSVPPYHFDVHYSTGSTVLRYLMRLEPFTRLFSKYYHKYERTADDLFDSFAQLWKSCMSSDGGAAELIPEFFYCPEVLQNINKVEVGTTQAGRRIDSLQLPPWAKDSYDFIRKHREALESEYVSLHLHHWIDLIFGYKQRPPHFVGGSESAIDAYNVFHHLSYQDSVDWEKIRSNNSHRYAEYMTTIADNGRTPCQLFTKPHPSRRQLFDVDLIWPIASIMPSLHTVSDVEIQKYIPAAVQCYKEYKLSKDPILFVCTRDEELISFDGTGNIGVHIWQEMSPDAIPPFRIKLDPSSHEMRPKSNSMFVTAFGPVKERRLSVPFSCIEPGWRRALKAKPDSESIQLEEPTKDFMWNRISVRSYEKEDKERLEEHTEKSPGSSDKQQSNVALACIFNHNRITSSLLSSRNFALIQGLDGSQFLISCGHWDSSIRITSCVTGRIVETLLHHRDIVTCLSMVKDFDQHWLVSGSRDCSMIVWKVTIDRSSKIIIKPIHTVVDHDMPISSLEISIELNIIVSGSENGTILMHTLRNGMLVRSMLDHMKDPPDNYTMVSPATNTLTPTSVDTTKKKWNVAWIGISHKGYIIAYSASHQTLATFSLNGTLIVKKKLLEHLYCFAISHDGNVLVHGGSSCLVVFRWIHSLALANDGPRSKLTTIIDGATTEYKIERFPSPIRSLYFTVNERHLLIGLESGELRIAANDSGYLRQRLHKRLVENGTL